MLRNCKTGLLLDIYLDSSLDIYAVQNLQFHNIKCKPFDWKNIPGMKGSIHIWIDTNFELFMILFSRSISLWRENSGVDNHGSNIRSSHIFHVREAITRDGPFRPSRFLEEKRWPPCELIGNHTKGRRHLLNFTWGDINYVPQPNNLVWSAKASTINQHQPNTCSPKFISSSYEPLSQLEVITFASVI